MLPTLNGRWTDEAQCGISGGGYDRSQVGSQCDDSEQARQGGQLAVRERLHHKEFVAGASKDPFTKVKDLITDRTRKPVRTRQNTVGTPQMS